MNSMHILKLIYSKFNKKKNLLMDVLYLVKGKCPIRNLNDNTKQDYVFIEIKCNSLEEAEQVLLERKKVYYDLSIVSI